MTIKAPIIKAIKEVASDPAVTTVTSFDPSVRNFGSRLITVALPPGLEGILPQLATQILQYRQQMRKVAIILEVAVARSVHGLGNRQPTKYDYYGREVVSFTAGDVQLFKVMERDFGDTLQVEFQTCLELQDMKDVFKRITNKMETHCGSARRYQVAGSRCPEYGQVNDALNFTNEIEKKLAEYRKRQCTNCSKTGPWNTCSGCKKVHYCSPDCQNTHWAQHKSDCIKHRVA